jgi:hypothetical protein
VLSEFLRALPLVEMAPDFALVKHAGGVVTHVLSSRQGEYAMYVDGSGPAEITLNLPAGEYEFSWVDVESGSVKKTVKAQHRGGDWVVKSPEFSNGIAVRIRRT